MEDMNVFEDTEDKIVFIDSKKQIRMGDLNERLNCGINYLMFSLMSKRDFKSTLKGGSLELGYDLDFIKVWCRTEIDFCFGVIDLCSQCTDNMNTKFDAVEPLLRARGIVGDINIFLGIIESYMNFIEETKQFCFKGENDVKALYDLVDNLVTTLESNHHIKFNLYHKLKR